VRTFSTKIKNRARSTRCAVDLPHGHFVSDCPGRLLAQRSRSTTNPIELRGAEDGVAETHSREERRPRRCSQSW
jgi:hypothetical protein